MALHKFTSESVSAGHPDKVCDQVSDLLVDMHLSQDPLSRLAIECMATTNRIIIAGEIRSQAEFSEEAIESSVRHLIQEIGYEQQGFDAHKLKFENYLHEQSADIAVGVDAGINKDEGAGDQGIMFGYACDETSNFMPAPIHYSHRILQKLHQLRLEKYSEKLGPDAKAQITFLYEDDKPIEIDTILVSSQHHADTSQKELRSIVMEAVANVFQEYKLPEEKNIITNPTGRFVIGGPDGDAGLTGRKIIVDTYGGAAPHGGGAFSGKDPTKVDRSAAYMMRYLAKNIVASGLAKRCTLQVAYSIGLSQPMSLFVDTHGTGILSDSALTQWLQKNIDLSPRSIRERLQLNKPIYLRTASYGHFGRTYQPEDGGFSWENLDLVDTLKALK